METELISPHVLHLIDTGGPGGAEMVFSAVAVHCQKLGINAGVAVPYDGWLADHLRQNGVVPEIVRSKGANPIILIARLIRLVKMTKPNVIHAHLLGSGVYGGLVGIILRVPVIAVFHGATDLSGNGSLVRTKRWILSRKHVTPVAVSEAVAVALEHWGLQSERIRVIRNGVDTAHFTPSGAGCLHDEMGLPRSTSIVGAVGNIRPAKSYEVLIQSAKIVLDAQPDTHFVVAGEGSERDVTALRVLIQREGIQKRFHLLGFRSSSAGLYRSFAVLASSANTEGLPLSFLEAMACGVPIAATANEGASRLLTETKAGLLSPVGDAAALASSIIRLLSDRAEAVRLGDVGRAAAIREFSAARTLKAYLDLYDSVLRGS